MGVTGFGSGNPRGPSNGGDVVRLKPSREVGPFLLTGSYHDVQPPCGSVFGTCVVPTSMIILVSHYPY